MNSLVAAHHDQVQFKNIINQDPQFQNDNIFYSDEQTLDQTTLANIDILLGNNQELLSKILNLPQARLAWIQLLSTGIDYLPLKQIQQHHILLTTLKGLHAEPIAESVIGMILSHYRALNFASRQHNWQKLTADLQMLSNKQVVIFGTGHIGSRCAQYCRHFMLILLASIIMDIRLLILKKPSLLKSSILKFFKRILLLIQCP